MNPLQNSQNRRPLRHLHDILPLQPSHTDQHKEIHNDRRNNRYDCRDQVYKVSPLKNDHSAPENELIDDLRHYAHHYSGDHRRPVDLVDPKPHFQVLADKTAVDKKDQHRVQNTAQHKGVNAEICEEDQNAQNYRLDRKGDSGTDQRHMNSSNRLQDRVHDRSDRVENDRHSQFRQKERRRIQRIPLRE